MSNLSKWNNLYERLYKEGNGNHSRLYGDGITYLMAATYFADVAQVEDWGCGTGGFRHYCMAKYIGLDGSNTPYADKIVDLETYRSSTEGIMLRHVLEHNYNWETVLQNALFSFRKKLFLCLFTPFGEETKEIAHNKPFGIDVPDISFCRQDVEKYLSGFNWKLIENIETNTQYHVEHVYLIQRNN